MKNINIAIFTIKMTYIINISHKSTLYIYIYICISGGVKYLYQIQIFFSKLIK